jgi:hypothetical protein
MLISRPAHVSFLMDSMVLGQVYLEKEYFGLL